MNRRTTLKLFASAALAGTGLDFSSKLCAEVPASSFPKEDFPTTDGAWTMLVMPDPQSYLKYSRNQGVLELMTAWIAENYKKFRIRQVLVTGDMVEQNNMGVGQYNQTSEQQWKAVSRAFERLDGVLPYIVCTGNHDYGIRSAENRETQLNTYFPSDRNPLWKDCLVEMGENTFGKRTLENAAYEFTTPVGQKMLTISLPFAPPDASLAWAKELCAREVYKNHFVTILTHSYLDGKSERPELEYYPLNKEGGNAGAGIWEKLVKDSPNIRFVVNGHFASPDSWKGTTSFRMDRNAAGKSVAQMMFNTQAMGGGWEGNGGDGWLRLVEFSADLKQMKVRTFSALYDIVPALKAQAWERSEWNQFEFTLD